MTPQNGMRGALGLLMLTVLVAACTRQTPVPDDGHGDASVQAAQAAIAEYAAALKGELQNALADGAVAAVDICHTRAAEIADEVGQAHGVTVGRTALKVRNPNNAPGDWERSTLNRFAAALADGQAPKELSAHTTTAEGQEVYMQPIMTAPLCLVCHGKTIDPALEGHIADLYPQDEARGFAAGDLRGAFIVRWNAGRAASR